jgi:hypothetical protein
MAANCRGLAPLPPKGGREQSGGCTGIGLEEARPPQLPRALAREGDVVPEPHTQRPGAPPTMADRLRSSSSARFFARSASLVGKGSVMMPDQ